MDEMCSGQKRMENPRKRISNELLSMRLSLNIYRYSTYIGVFLVFKIGYQSIARLWALQVYPKSVYRKDWDNIPSELFNPA